MVQARQLVRVVLVPLAVCLLPWSSVPATAGARGAAAEPVFEEVEAALDGSRATAAQRRAVLAATMTALESRSAIDVEQALILSRGLAVLAAPALDRRALAEVREAYESREEASMDAAFAVLEVAIRELPPSQRALAARTVRERRPLHVPMEADSLADLLKARLDALLGGRTLDVRREREVMRAFERAARSGLRHQRQLDERMEEVAELLERGDAGGKHIERARRRQADAQRKLDEVVVDLVERLHELLTPQERAVVLSALLLDSSPVAQ